MTTQETTAKERIPIEPYTTDSRRLIEHAEEELVKGDRLQASEKAWGAVAHQLKAIADRRGWEYEQHIQVYGIVDRLAEETEDPVTVRRLFAIANGLHKNYYVDATPLNAIEYQISEVKTLLEFLTRPEIVSPAK